MIDPNVYALSIELQLETATAFASLDQFEAKITSIEEQAAKSAQKALGSMQSIITGIEETLTNVNVQLRDVNSTAISIQHNFSQTASDFKDTFDTGAEQLKNLKKELSFLTDISDIYIRIDKSLKEMTDKNAIFLKGVGDITKAIDLKNAGHIAQNKLMEDGSDTLVDVLKQSSRYTQNVNNGTRSWQRSFNAIAKVINVLLEANKAAEQFVTTNYRAYGSQEQLAQSTRSLTAELGVSSEVAISAYKSLADLRVPREELDKYAKIVAIANRTTGAGISILANYVNRLRAIGMATPDIERQITQTTEAMRKFGLNTQDVNSLLSDSSVNALRIKSIFGGNAKAVKEWDDWRNTMAGFGRQVGINAGELNSFFDQMSNNVASMAIFKSFTNTAEKGMEGMQLATMRAGLKINEQMTNYEKLVTEGKMSAESMIAQRKSLIKVYFQGNEAAYEASRALGVESKRLKLTGADIKEYEKLVESLANTQAKQLAEANDTLTGQWNRMWNALRAVSGSVSEFIGEGLKNLIGAINKILVPMAEWITTHIAWLKEFEKTHPRISAFITAIKTTIAVIVVIIAGFVAFGAAVTSFGVIFAGIPKLITGISKAVVGLARIFLTAVKTIGQGIIIILNSIGKGLFALGNSVKTVILPLMGLAVSMVLIAASAYIFAHALILINQAGIDIIPAATNLAVAILILGAALLLLSAGAVFVAPGLYIMAGALLAVGIAAALVGLGMSWFSEGLQTVSEVLGGGLLVLIPQLGVALAALAAAVGVWAIAKLAALGVAMISVGEGASFLGTGITSVANALKLLPADPTTIADKLLEMAKKLGDSGNTFWTASKALLSGSKALIAAIPTLSEALALLTKVSKELSESSTIIFDGSNALKTSTTMLQTAGQTLEAGGTALYTGLETLLRSIPLMTRIKTELLAGITILSTALETMFPVSMLLLASGIMIKEGGLAFTDGVTTLLAGATQLQVMGTLLLTASQTSFEAAVKLYETGILLVISGVLLESGAISILASSMVITDAINMLTKAGISMIPAAAALYFGMNWLNFAIEKSASSVTKIVGVANAYTLLANALNLFKSISFESLKEFSQIARGTLPEVIKIADDLSLAANSLTYSVDKFKKPADQLTMILDNLSFAIAEFSTNSNLADNVGQMAEMLDQYAGLLENAADRIETAIITKAVPAMKAAEEAGIEEAIRSEAISTVKVMDQREGHESDFDEITELNQKQLDALQSIDEKLDGSSSTDKFYEILAVLNKYLPGIGNRESELSSNLNCWN